MAYECVLLINELLRPRGDRAMEAARLYGSVPDCDPDVERGGSDGFPVWVKVADDVDG